MIDNPARRRRRRHRVPKDFREAEWVRAAPFPQFAAWFADGVASGRFSYFDHPQAFSQFVAEAILPRDPEETALALALMNTRHVRHVLPIIAPQGLLLARGLTRVAIHDAQSAIDAALTTSAPSPPRVRKKSHNYWSMNVAFSASRYGTLLRVGERYSDWRIREMANDEVAFLRSRPFGPQGIRRPSREDPRLPNERRKRPRDYEAVRYAILELGGDVPDTPMERAREAKIAAARRREGLPARSPRDARLDELDDLAEERWIGVARRYVEQVGERLTPQALFHSMKETEAAIVIVGRFFADDVVSWGGDSESHLMQEAEVWATPSPRNIEAIFVCSRFPVIGGVEANDEERRHYCLDYWQNVEFRLPEYGYTDDDWISLHADVPVRGLRGVRQVTQRTAPPDGATWFRVL